MDEVLLRSLTPGVLGVLVRRGADCAAVEDAVQDVLVEAVRVWPAGLRWEPKGWLVAVAWCRFLDAARVDVARRRGEGLVDGQPAAGLLALMLLHHARRAPRTAPDGGLVPLAEQDRGRWDTRLIAEGVAVLRAVFVRDRSGEFQAQAVIAALYADAPAAEETDWVGSSSGMTSSCA